MIGTIFSAKLVIICFNDFYLYFNYAFSTKLCKDTLVEQKKKIDGPGKIVEIDETNVVTKQNTTQEIAETRAFLDFKP